MSCGEFIIEVVRSFIIKIIIELSMETTKKTDSYIMSQDTLEENIKMWKFSMTE